MGGGSNPKVLDYVLVVQNKAKQKSYHSRVLILRGDDDPEMFTGSPYGDTDLSDHFSIEANINFN